MWLALQEVDLTIHYRPGRINKVADSLSYFPVVQASGHVACLQEFPPVVSNDNSCAGRVIINWRMISQIS